MLRKGEGRRGNASVVIIRLHRSRSRTRPSILLRPGQRFAIRSNVAFAERALLVRVRRILGRIRRRRIPLPNRRKRGGEQLSFLLRLSWDFPRVAKGGGGRGGGVFACSDCSGNDDDDEPSRQLGKRGGGGKECFLLWSFPFSCVSPLLPLEGLQERGDEEEKGAKGGRGKRSQPRVVVGRSLRPQGGRREGLLGRTDSSY